MGGNREGRAATPLPILIFLPIFLGSEFITGDFYSMPAIVTFLITLLVVFMQNRELGFTEKIKLAAQGMGDESIITMCLIFPAAGAFTGTVKAVGGADSMVNLGLSILPFNMTVAGLLLIECFISISMRTSVGTTTAPAPITMGISQRTGFSTAVCTGTMVGGIMSGNSPSMISDTTIAAVETQGCEMRDRFKENFLIVLSAAIITILLFLVLGKDASLHIQGSLNYSLPRVVPYMVVLVGALAGVNVFLVFMVGIVLSLIAGVAAGAFGVGEMFTYVEAKIAGMYDIIVISVIVAYIVAPVKKYGRIALILSFTKKRVNGERGGEPGVTALVLLVDMCMANNTVTIVTAGLIAKEISDGFGVIPRRSVPLLGVFSSTGQGLIPYGAQFLAAASLTGLTPFRIIPYYFCPIPMGVNGLPFIFIKKRHGKVLA